MGQDFERQVERRYFTFSTRFGVDRDPQSSGPSTMPCWRSMLSRIGGSVSFFALVAIFAGSWCFERW